MFVFALCAAGCAPSAIPAAAGDGVPGAQAGSRRGAATPPPGACELPAAQRTQEVGCYLTAMEPLGTLPAGPVFWHVYQYPSRAAAQADAARRSTIVEAFGRVMLYAIAEEGWRPPSGERIAVIGPLAHESGSEYTARYIEGVFTPGMQTRVHRHSGVEAWYVLDGAQCLETPDDVIVVRAGENATVAGGQPMVLTGIGGGVRRSIALVLHPSSEPWITPANDWAPADRCPSA